VLHLCFRQENGSPFYLDMDLNCPSLSTSNIDSYDGSINSYKRFLRSSRPVGWREEMGKLEDMFSAGAYPGVTRSVRIRCISPGVVIPSQALLFLSPDTLEGEKLDVYCLGKMLKYFTRADVTSYKLKWALEQKLFNAPPADVGGIGAALRLVLTHTSLRDKFTGVNKELEEAGFRSIQVTDTGFRLIRDWDTGLNQEMAFGAEEDIDDAFN